MGKEYNKENIRFAKQLRKNATDEEKSFGTDFCQNMRSGFKGKKR